MASPRCQAAGWKSTPCENLAATSGKHYSADESPQFLHTLNTSVAEPTTPAREGAQTRPSEMPSVQRSIPAFRAPSGVSAVDRRWLLILWSGGPTLECADCPFSPQTVEGSGREGPAKHAKLTDRGGLGSRRTRLVKKRPLQPDL